MYIYICVFFFVYTHFLFFVRGSCGPCKGMGICAIGIAGQCHIKAWNSPDFPMARNNPAF